MFGFLLLIVGGLLLRTGIAGASEQAQLEGRLKAEGRYQDAVASRRYNSKGALIPLGVLVCAIGLVILIF